MGSPRTCSAAKALCMLVLLIVSLGTAMAQDRREALEALERERTQVLRDAQARSAPQWSAAAAVAWLPPIENETLLTPTEN